MVAGRGEEEELACRDEEEFAGSCGDLVHEQEKARRIGEVAGEGRRGRRCWCCSGDGLVSQRVKEVNVVLISAKER